MFRRKQALKQLEPAQRVQQRALEARRKRRGIRVVGLVLVLVLSCIGFGLAQITPSNEIEFYCFVGECDLWVNTSAVYGGPADDLWQWPAYCNAGRLLYFSKFYVPSIWAPGYEDSVFGWSREEILSYPVGTEFVVFAGEAPCYIFRAFQ